MDRALKRLFDISCSAVGLIVLAPVLAICAICVRLSSRGPILFRQERVGLHGRIFRIMKLRTMVSTGPATGPMITVGDDMRITKLGGVLRKWKLDELPQLWNVLVGDMSIVGPRPEVPNYVATYSPEMRQLILSMRPGITDPSSINMRDESAILAKEPDPERYYRERLLPEKLRLSGEYISRRSVASDVGIVLKTIVSILRPPSSPRY